MPLYCPKYICTTGRLFLLVYALSAAVCPLLYAEDISNPSTLSHSPAQALVEKYCIDCHNPQRKKGKLDLKSILSDDMREHPLIWENVMLALDHREMPPEDEPNLPRPSEAEYTQTVTWLNDVIAKDFKVESSPITIPPLATLDHYCTSCHSGTEAQSGLDIETLLTQPLQQHPETWETIIRRLNARQMPPHGKRWPDTNSYNSVIDFLQTQMDAPILSEPNPGRTSTFRRLTRKEYANAIRDLLHLEIDTTELLPRDEVSHGFDNITVTKLTPTLMDRYISAAQKISRLAVGLPLPNPVGDIIRIKPDLSQNDHVDGLPLGTRGGALIPYHFPRTGSYEIQVTLTRDRNEKIEGLHTSAELLFLLNGDTLETFTINVPNKKSGYDQVDKHLKLRINVEAGQQELGITFIEQPETLLERKREPLEASFNFHRHPRTKPAVYQVSITGPYQDMGPGKTDSRQKILGTQKTTQEGIIQAEQILRRLARQAYRRPVSDADIHPLMHFYEDERAHGGNFEDGIEVALSAILVNPNFLFRIELEPNNAQPGQVYAISDIELATRLSFFLWSSLPDEELIRLAENNQLNQPKILETQTLRMLQDSRASVLTENFAAQWLYLRNLESVTPDNRLFTDFDDNLRQAMRRETELLFEDIIRNDKNVLELITSDYTYLNERIAKHYEISGIYGNRFRKVKLDPASMRGGLLRHGSILSVTSYANRTSPVIRGAWILENIIGTPPPPPPPDVTTFDDTVIAENLPIRQKLELHRSNPNCASCHELMDPIGFALENYDAIGKRRYHDKELKIDASGVVADGTTFQDVEELEDYILKYPENFVRTMVEKLLIYGLGRGVEYYDMPTVREVVRKSSEQNYSFSSLINGIVQSHTFQHRTAQ